MECLTYWQINILSLSLKYAENNCRFLMISCILRISQQQLSPWLAYHRISFVSRFSHKQFNDLFCKKTGNSILFRIRDNFHFLRNKNRPRRFQTFSLAISFYKTLGRGLIRSSSWLRLGSFGAIVGRIKTWRPIENIWTMRLEC